MTEKDHSSQLPTFGEVLWGYPSGCLLIVSSAAVLLFRELRKGLEAKKTRLSSNEEYSPRKNTYDNRR